MTCFESSAALLLLAAGYTVFICLWIVDERDRPHYQAGIIAGWVLGLGAIVIALIAYSRGAGSP